MCKYCACLIIFFFLTWHDLWLLAKLISLVLFWHPLIDVCNHQITRLLIGTKILTLISLIDIFQLSIFQINFKMRNVMDEKICFRLTYFWICSWISRWKDCSTSSEKFYKKWNFFLSFSSASNCFTFSLLHFKHKQLFLINQINTL